MQVSSGRQEWSNLVPWVRIPPSPPVFDIHWDSKPSRAHPGDEKWAERTAARPAGFGGGAIATGEKESHPLRQSYAWLIHSRKVALLLRCIDMGLEAEPSASSGGRMSYRIELDLAQSQLAQRINAKQKSISRYETGASLPSIKPWSKSPKSSKNQLDISWMSKAKKPKRINLHKSFKRKERPIYNFFRSIFECCKAQLCHSSFVKWNRLKIYPRITRPQAFKGERDLYFCK